MEEESESNTNKNEPKPKPKPRPNESKKVIYPPLETLLSVIQKEYEYESDRSKSFENRTGFLLS
jgi:hypothetical protein